MHINEVVDKLKVGKIAILPTDTIYALSCDATSEEAVSAIYRYKCREEAKALPVFFASISQVIEVCEFNEMALLLAEKFWPGPLTMILPFRPTKAVLAKNINNGSSTVAVRVPSSDIICDIVLKLGRPLVATSANISGQEPITDYKAAKLVFGDDITMLEGKIGNTPSSIIEPKENSYKMLREGVITKEMINSFIASLHNS